MPKHFVYLLLAACFLQSALSLDKCTSSSATLWDGYLDTYMYYASFDRTQNSYMQFTNPFSSINPLNSITVAFWAKFPTVSSDGLYQSGTLLDCSDSGLIKFTNGSLSYSVFQPSSISNFQTATLNSSQTSSSIQSWNSYAFSVSSSTQYLFYNGVNLNQKLAFSALGTSSSVCNLGNSLSLSSPINAYIRHLYFSKLGWTTSTNVTNLVHHLYLATDSNMLSYFMFSQNSGLNDTYFLNTSRQINSNGVSIQYTNQPEFVCYCSDSYPNFMKVNSSYSLNSFNLSNLSTQTIDNNGFTLAFQSYSYQPSSWSGDVLLFNLSNYASVYVTNNSNTIRLDLFNTTNSVTASASLSFKDYRFRYNTWALISIALTKTSATLQVDGILMDQISHSVALPTNTSNFTIGQSSSFSYLLNTLTLKNAKTSAATLLNYTFTENYMNAANTTRLVSSGTMLFGSSNTMCNSSSTALQNYWTGFGCTDNRLFPYFNGNKSTGYFQSQISSSMSTMTIELWIRDINMVANTTQVIFENSIDGTNPVIQMGINTGATTSTGRSLFCSPLKTSSPSSIMTLSAQTTYNVWGHFSCVSDVSVTMTTAYYYNSNTQTTVSSSLSNTVFMNQQSTVLTTLGSRIDGTSRFIGFVREFRIWSEARSSYNLQLQRFQAQSPTQTNLLSYFLLSDQVNPLTLVDAQKKLTYFTEQVPLSPVLEWNVDKDLVICQPGLYYDGQCCSAFNISNVTFQFVIYKNNITAYVDSSSLNNAGLFPSMKANFSVVAVGNNFTYTSGSSSLYYLTYISSLFQSNGTQYLNISSYFVNPLVYNITLQAIIYSDYNPSVTVTRTQILKLTCPMVYLNILPDYVTDNTQIVSLNSTDKSPDIYATSYMQCYNAATKQTSTNTLTSLIWSLNTTEKFSNLFTVASDNQSLSSNVNKSQYITSSYQYQQLTAKLTYNKTLTVSNTIQLYYAPIMINPGKTASSLSYNSLTGSMLFIDLSSATSSSSAYSLSYSVNCPSSIFYNTSSYNSLCAFPTTPDNVFSLDTSQITVVANYPYSFYFYITISGTSIMDEVIASVQFYKDGGLTNCPKVTLPSNYTYTYGSQTTVQILPDPYLYCIGTYYQLYEGNWTVVDSITGANMNSVLSYGSQTAYRYANLTPSSVSSIQSGTILNLTVQFNTTQSTTNQGGYISNATTQIIFSQTPTVVSIVAYDQNKTVLPNNQLNYTESMLILNASTSYDPNNLTANLSFTWYCPSIVQSQYICQSLSRGTFNQYLYINALQRVKIGFQFNTQYNFTVTATSVNNPYKTPVNQTISIYFNPPTKNDSKINYVMTATCDSVNASGGSLAYFNSSYQKTVRYDITNYTSSNIYIQTATTSTSCKYGNADDQVMFIYFFDLYNNTLSPYYIFEQNLITGVKTSTNSSLNLTLPVSLLSANFSSMYQANIYWFTQRESSLDAVYLSIDTVFLWRQRANLVASITPPKQTIDKFNNLILNASTSYDPENLNTSITYKWTCPGTISTCASQNSSVITVLYKDRYNGGANTNGTNYTYSLVMSDSTRNSSTAYSYISVSQQSSYASCLSTTLNTTFLNSYSQASNQTLYLQYNQTVPVSLVMGITSYCQNVNIETSAYYPQSGSTFWTLDSSTSPSTVILNSTNFMKYLQSNILSTIIFKQQYSMGFGTDTNTKLNLISYVNVNMTQPDLYVSIVGPRVAYFNDNSQTILLDASGSYDPASPSSLLKYQWNCPSYFGGDSCQSINRLTLTYSSLSALNSNLSSYYNMSHQFTLIVTTNDRSRTTTKDFYLYLSDSTGPFAQAGVSSCGLYLVNDTGAAALPFESQNVFQYSCPSNPSITTSLINGNKVEWSVSNLTQNVDYFYANNYLYLNAFIASKLPGQTEIVLSAIIDNVITYPFQWSFPIVSQELNYNPAAITGQEYVLFNPNGPFFAYNQTYNLTFSGFQSTRGFGLMASVRGWSNSYNSYQLVYPILPIMNVTNAYFYQSLVLTLSASLYLDFFDMNFNYMGSYDLQDQNFSSLALGYYDQDSYEDILYPLCSKTVANYTNTTMGQYQYMADVESVRKLQQGLSFGMVIYDGSSGRVETDYALEMITFYTNTLVSMLTYFNPYSSVFVKEQRYQIERKSIYVISKMVQTGTNYSAIIGPVLTLLEQIQKDYSSIISEGSDQDVWTQQIITIIEYTQSQLNSYISLNGNTSLAQSQWLRIKALSAWIVGGDFSGLSLGQSASFIQFDYNKIALSINPNTSTSVQFNSLINTEEQVSVASQAYLSSLGVANLEFSFTNRDNDSSPTSTILYMYAYDSNYLPLNPTFGSTVQQASPVALQEKKKFSLFQQIFKQRDQIKAQEQLSIFQDQSFLITDSDWKSESTKPHLKDDSSVYVSFALQAKTEYQELFNSTLADSSSSTYLYPVCVYYQALEKTWAQDGLYNISYDYKTGLLNCSTTMVGQFSMDYISLNKVTINNGSSSTNTTNTTSSYFFDGYTLYYYLGVGIPSFITLATIFLSCISFTVWEAKNPRLEKLRKQEPGCFAICKATCLLHHLFISAICSPKKSNVHLTIPKSSKMVDLWWLFYAILAAVGLTLWQTPTVQWTNKLQIDTLTNTTMITTEIKSYDHNMELCGFILGVILVGRMFVLSLGYTFYFMGKGPEMALKGESDEEIMGSSSKFESDRGTDLEDNLIKKPKAKKGKKKKSRSRQLREENNFEMEGGSSEEEQKQKKSSKSKNRTGNSSRSKDKQIDALPKKKSGTRYEEYEKGSSSKQSRVKADQNSSSENKNLVDIIGEINEKTQQKRNAKRQINDSGVKASSGVAPASTQVLSTKHSNRRSESPAESQPKRSASKNADNSLESKRVTSKNLKLDEQEKPPSKVRSRGQSKSPDKIEARGVANETSKKINKQDLFVDDNAYNNSRMNSKVSEKSSMQEPPAKSTLKKKSGDSTSSSVYRPQKQYQDEMSKNSFTEEASKVKKKKKKTRTSSQSPSQDVGNYRIQNVSTKINSSIDSYYDIDSEVGGEKKNKSKKKSQSSTVDEEYVIGQYKTTKYCTFWFKFLLLLGCMGITFWMMRWLVDLPHLYSWLAMSGLVYFVLALIIEPIFILIFSLFFKCTNGSGCCIRAAALVLLGNGHSNVINGVLYEANQE